MKPAPPEIHNVNLNVNLIQASIILETNVLLPFCENFNLSSRWGFPIPTTPSVDRSGGFVICGQCANTLTGMSSLLIKGFSDFLYFNSRNIPFW